MIPSVRNVKRLFIGSDKRRAPAGRPVEFDAALIARVDSEAIAAIARSAVIGAEDEAARGPARAEIHPDGESIRYRLAEEYLGVSGTGLLLRTVFPLFLKRTIKERLENGRGGVIRTLPLLAGRFDRSAAPDSLSLGFLSKR